MYFGWEGVGLASYLLIGFWHHKESANKAAIKAFIVNRVGDFGYTLGIVGIFFVFGSIYFDTIFSQAENFSSADSSKKFPQPEKISPLRGDFSSKKSPKKKFRREKTKEIQRG